MKGRGLPYVLAILLTVIPEAHGQPATAEQAAEIETLKQKVHSLESQNRAILHALEDLKAALTQHGVPIVATGKDETPIVATAEETTEPTPADEAPPATAEKKDTVQLVKWNELVMGESRLKLYGFLRLDTIVDTAQADNAQRPFFIRSRDAAGGGDLNFTMHPRLTRLGLLFDGPRIRQIGDGKIGGKLEFDFQNGGSESRQVIRIRHAYFDTAWSNLTLLAGQTWDVISPLYPTVNNDTLMWNAGNLGDRRPQARLAYARPLGAGSVDLAGAVGLTGAVDGQDLDVDGTRDGERSVAPNLQGRIGYTRALWNDDPTQMTVGAWGHYAWEETDSPVAGHSDFTSDGLGLDLRLALSRRFALRGEGWYGHNLDDFRGGINQGINTVNGREIESAGGWAELMFTLNPVYSAYTGYTVDDPRNADVAVEGRTMNYAWYIGNRFRLGQPLLIGVDYLRWTTDYRGLRSATDNRVNVYLQYDF
jgi:hypothetical protein